MTTDFNSQYNAHIEAERAKYQADMADTPPLQEDDWSWWVGSNEEWFTTKVETRDEAIQVGRDEMDDFYITEARHGELDLARAFDIEAFFDAVNDQFEDWQHDEFEGFMNGYSQQSLDLLETMVRQTIRRWQVQMRDERGEKCIPTVFTETRNKEFFQAEGCPA